MSGSEDRERVRLHCTNVRGELDGVVARARAIGAGDENEERSIRCQGDVEKRERFAVEYALGYSGAQGITRRSAYRLNDSM